MGLLVDGKWQDKWYDTSKSGGSFSDKLLNLDLTSQARKALNLHQSMVDITYMFR